MKEWTKSKWTLHVSGTKIYEYQSEDSWRVYRVGMGMAGLWSDRSPWTERLDKGESDLTPTQAHAILKSWGYEMDAKPIEYPPKPSDKRLVDWGMMLQGECRVPVEGVDNWVTPNGIYHIGTDFPFLDMNRFEGRRWILIPDPMAYAKQAFRDKDLWTDHNKTGRWTKWGYNSSPHYSYDPECYGRKPKEVEKVVRVWTADEGLGKHIRPKVWSVSGGRVIISAGRRWVRIAQQTELINKGDTPFRRLTYQEIKDNWIQTNGKPCGVEE